MVTLSVHGHTAVCCLILSPFPCTYHSSAHTLSCLSVCFILSYSLGMLPLCGLLSGQTVNTVCICCRFPSVIFFLYDILFCNVGSSIISLSDLRSTATDTCLLHEQAVCLYFMYWPCITLLTHVFSKDSRHVPCNPFFASLFPFVLFNSSKSLLLFQLLFHICLTAVVTSNNIYIMVFFTFCVQIFRNIDYLCYCTSLQFVTCLFLLLLPSCLHTAYPRQLYGNQFYILLVFFCPTVDFRFSQTSN